MINIKETVLKKAENRVRENLTISPKKIYQRNSPLSLISNLITMSNQDSFLRIASDMSEFPVLKGKDFDFYRENPNQKYRLVKGRYKDSPVEAKLITDAQSIELRMSCLGNNTITNPLFPSYTMKLQDSTLQEVELSAATFAIEQYLIEGEMAFIRFISTITDREELKKIASYIDYIPTKSNARVLTIDKC